MLLLCVFQAFLDCSTYKNIIITYTTTNQEPRVQFLYLLGVGHYLHCCNHLVFLLEDILNHSNNSNFSTMEIYYHLSNTSLRACHHSKLLQYSHQQSFHFSNSLIWAKLNSRDQFLKRTKKYANVFHESLNIL